MRRFPGFAWGLCLSACISSASAQARVWAAVFGPAARGGGYGLAADRNGDIVAINGALARFNTEGKRLWSRYGTGSGLALGSDGGIYVAGTQSAPLQKWWGDGDIRLSKSGKDGSPIWTRLSGTDSVETGDDVALDTAGNVYAAGTTKGDLEGNRNQGERDGFLMKYDAAGAKLWTRSFGNGDYAFPVQVAVDRRGNAYVGGVEGQFFVFRKLSPEGSEEWYRTYATDTLTAYCAMAVDGEGNSCFLGFTRQAIEGQAGAGGTDLFATRYDAKGVKQWTRVWGSAKNEFLRDALMDSAGNLIVLGQTMPEGDGKDGSGLSIVKYDTAGRLVWSAHQKMDGYDQGEALAVDGAGNVFTLGVTYTGLGTSMERENGKIFLMKFAPYAPSFDCAQASSLQEDLICRSRVLAGLDDSIAGLQAAYEKIAPDRARAGIEHAAWIKGRDACDNAEQMETYLRKRAVYLRTKLK